MSIQLNAHARHMWPLCWPNTDISCINLFSKDVLPSSVTVVISCKILKKQKKSTQTTVLRGHIADSDLDLMEVLRCVVCLPDAGLWLALQAQVRLIFCNRELLGLAKSVLPCYYVDILANPVWNLPWYLLNPDKNPNVTHCLKIPLCILRQMS